MRIVNSLTLLALAAVSAVAQVQAPRPDAASVSSMFSSGLAVSLLNADTVPASIVSVNSGSDFGGFNFFAAGSWVEIKGAGLSDTTRTWAGGDFGGGGLNAPTSLDNVRVTVNNIPAYVYYISPTQLNVQTPGDATLGPVEVRVFNASGGTAATTSQKMPTAAGMLAPAAFNVGGKQYMVAQFSDQVFVGRTGLIAGAAFRPAKPGDNITVYGIGFGDVLPAIPPGTVVTQTNALSLPFTLAFGSTPAALAYKGLAPNFVGLYQFNITVPAVTSDGDFQINMTLNGQPLPQPPLYLTIQR